MLQPCAEASQWLINGDCWALHAAAEVNQATQGQAQHAELHMTATAAAVLWNTTGCLTCRALPLGSLLPVFRSPARLPSRYIV